MISQTLLNLILPLVSYLASYFIHRPKKPKAPAPL